MPIDLLEYRYDVLNEPPDTATVEGMKVLYQNRMRRLARRLLCQDPDVAVCLLRDDGQDTINRFEVDKDQIVIGVNGAEITLKAKVTRIRILNAKP